MKVSEKCKVAVYGPQIRLHSDGSMAGGGGDGVGPGSARRMLVTLAELGQDSPEVPGSDGLTGTRGGGSRGSLYTPAHQTSKTHANIPPILT